MERAPLLLVFGDLAGRMAALVRARPILIARLIVAPREAVHAIAAFLHLAPDAGRPDEAVATAINDADPRDLLRAALPGCPARLYRALDRAGDHAHPRRFYERLGDICRGPFSDALLDSGALDDARLGFFETLSRMDPALATLAGALDGRVHLAEAADSLLALLRARGALRDDDLRLPPRAGMRAVARRLRAALARIKAPDPGFAAPAPFRLVRTTAELQNIGRAFGNCVALPDWHAARQHINMIQGTTVFLASDDPPLLASLNRFADRVWQIDQVQGPRNEPPPPGTIAALACALRACGQTVVATDPHSSLGRLAHEAARRDRRAIEVDPGDGDDEEEIAS
jgi:hypothetical protein